MVFYDFGGLIDLFGLVRVIVGWDQAVGDFSLLRMHRRIDRRQPGMACAARMLFDRLTERIMFGVARSFGGLRRLESHVVPAEILEIAADLAETLGTHGRASTTLAGEQA